MTLPNPTAAVGRMAALVVPMFVACGERGRSSDPEPGPRVVSLHDVTTEIVVALDATDRLRGIAEPVDLAGDVQNAVLAVPRVAGIESIVSVRPDVVLGLGVVAEQDPELVHRLKHEGIDVQLADPATLDDVAVLIQSVAGRLGTGGAGEQLVARLRANTATKEVSPKPPVRVFVYDCCDPPFTAGGKTVLTDLITRAGGSNIFSDLDVDWMHVSWEQVIVRRPELVVIHSYGQAQQGDVADKQNTLRRVSALAELPTAVVPLGCSLGGLRSIEGLERLRLAMRERS